jgi:hypothetical protein
MVEIEEALQICADRITKGTHHHYYDRVVKHASLYEKLITGEGHDELLNDVFSDLSPEELTKLLKITYPITSSITNALMFAFSKVLRTNPSYKKIDFEGTDTDKKIDKVQVALDNYYAGSSVEYYIEKRFHDLSFTDPNAFVVTEFINDNPDSRLPQPYPFEVSSVEAVNYKYINKVLQYLLVENKITYINDGKKKDGIKLTAYLYNDSMTFTQVEKVHSLTEGDKAGFIYPNGDTSKQPIFFINNEDEYQIEYYNHKQGRVPAQAVGYVPDKKTRGITYVNPFHYGAIPHLMKTIKSVAEMDLTANKHAFPQKISYTEGCTFNDKGVCSTSGYRVDQCTKCGKKGFETHQSAKDIVTFKLPRDPKDMISLESLVVYKYPPIDGVTWMQQYINELTEKCYKATFNSEVFSKNIVVQTATEKTVELQNIYDTLYPYANRIANFWTETVVDVAKILDLDRPIVKLVYPKDFKLKSLTELLADMTAANASGAPVFIKTEITRDIANLMYADKPLELQKYEAKMALFPFPGKGKDEILMGISAGLATKLDAVLYMYFDALTEQLETESGINIPKQWEDLLEEEPDVLEQLRKANAAKLYWFYDLPYTVQRELLYARAKEKMDIIQEETPTAIPFGSVGGGA